MIKRLVNSGARLANLGRQLQLRMAGVEVDHTCWISQCVSVKLGFADGSSGEIQLAAQNRLEQGVVLDAWGGKIVIDENVFLGPYTVIYGHGGVFIGRDSLIAMHCRILSSNHTIPDCSKRIRWEPDIQLPTKIGKDVWLGAGVTVLGGVTIGDGCIVGAGAVVTKDLPSYSVAIGVPARVVRTRTCEDQSHLSIYLNPL